MSRLTIRAEEDGVKAVWYGERDVFIEGEIGYAEADKLAHYEDLEEQCRLIELPCAVGDEVYIIWGPRYRAGHAVYGIHTGKFGLSDIPNLNNTVFVTREAAESKLKEMEGEEWLSGEKI